MRAVFEDPSGKRRLRLFGLVSLSTVVISVVATIFGVSLALIPLLAPPSPAVRNSLPEALVLNRRHARQRAELVAHRQQRRARPREKTALPAGSPVAAAFYAPWEDAGLESFQAYAGHLNVVVPAWLRLADDGVSIDDRDYDFAANPRNSSLVNAARRAGVAVVPLISNAQEGAFSPASVRKLLDSEARQSQFSKNLLTWVQAHEFQGINFDFELIPQQDWPALGRFIRRLSSDFHAKNLIVTADLEASLSARLASPVVDACDWVVLMVYDEHSEDGEAGPIASFDWINEVWDRWTDAFPVSKLVMGVGSFGYDWSSKGGAATSISFDDVMSTASEYRDSESPRSVIHVDPDSRNPYFVYDDDDNVRHSVWFLDAMTAYNQWRAAQESGTRGIALWVLGNEDPAIWSFLNRGTLTSPPDPSALRQISFPYEIDFRGAGEILRVVQRPRQGSRRFTLDSDGDIQRWIYEGYAFPFLIEKSGFQPRKLVLTFDDGPDPRFTPEIIDVLQRLHAPATFFVLGEQAVRYPGLVAKLWDAGFEIGNHSYTHPDLGAVGEQRALLELNATQRALEAILGRSTRLFRPPYNADSQPETAAQVRPVEIADRLQYITVGENIDPNDWDLRQQNPDGSFRRKDGHDIAEDVVREVESKAGSGDEGNVILLHDAGGDRSATVAALDELIPELRRKGYQFVSLSQLLRRDRESLMPAVRTSDLGLVGVDRVVFMVSSFVESTLRFLFFAGILIGISRALLMTCLAWVNRHEREFKAPGTPLKAGVLIAAWHEEEVIGATIRSVLGSSYPLEEVIVIDDGSTDDTAEVVKRVAEGDARVRLIRKPNGGKASALNVGYHAAQADVLICLDADTVLHPEAIGFLVRHFDDERVAAVAGNVRVGNAGTILTRWQSLEYTTSQNLDRRAQARLNCITVVPGAIGAWRRESVLRVGGYDVDTLAEDMDLTWRLHLAGYRIENEVRSLSFTEAPESGGAFFRQRFRWAYGTLQCLWKHRRAFGRAGWFGRFALPQLWLFQVVFQVLAPLIDLTVAASLFAAIWVGFSLGGASVEVDRLAVVRGDLTAVLGSYGLFYLVEMAAGWLAYSMERRPKGDLWFLFLQRLVYRQIMYAVIWKALWRALGGGSTKWGKLRRLGTVRAESLR